MQGRIVGSTRTDELYHYGVKGMKWGVRKRTKEEKQKAKEYHKDYGELKTLKRHVAATKQHMRQQGGIADNSRARMDSAHRDFVRESTRGWFTRDPEAIKAAESRLRDATKEHEANQTEYLRAKRFYEADAEKYVKKVDDMVQKYGEKSVSKIRTEDIMVGSSYIKDVIRTGITVADLPLIGPDYRYDYISKLDRQDRHERLNERASRG